VQTLSGTAVQLPSRQFAGPQPAKVLRVTAGKLYVELESAQKLEIGPCAWGHPAAHNHTDPGGGNTGTTTPADPAAGTRCLILFAGPGVTDPWVVAWSGWPA
jgi:hypothetical protein